MEEEIKNENIRRILEMTEQMVNDSANEAARAGDMQQSLGIVSRFVKVEQNIRKIAANTQPTDQS